jgi:hypothetical protein
MMDNDTGDASNLNPDNIIPVTLDDLSKDDRLEIKRKLEEQKAEALSSMLTGFSKTRSGAVKKVTTPNPPPATDTKVRNTEEIAHLIDVSIASKYGDDMAKATRTVTEISSKFDKIRGQFETSIPHQVCSLVLQLNNENSQKNLMPLDNSRFANLQNNMHTPVAPANVMQPHIAESSNQGGRNYASGSANNFTPSVAVPIVSTSVPQNYNNNNRSVGLNTNF